MQLKRNVLFPIRARLAIVLLAVGLAACQPSVTPVPHPTPDLLSVQVTPALLRLLPVFHDCAAAGDLALLIDDLPAQSLDPGRADLALRWGGPGEFQGAAYQIDREALVVIVHPSNRMDWLPLTTIRQIYTGKVTAWSSPGDDPVATPAAGDSINPWIYPAGDDVQEAFVSSILAGNHPTSPAISLAPGPDAMLEVVAGDPAAIGFVPAGWLTDDVKTVEIIHEEPNLVSQPVVALSAAKPIGVAQDWLLCVQGALEREENDH